MDQEESFVIFLLRFPMNFPLHHCSSFLKFFNTILYNFQHFLETKDDTHFDTPLINVLAIKNWQVSRKKNPLKPTMIHTLNLAEFHTKKICKTYRKPAPEGFLTEYKYPTS